MYQEFFRFSAEPFRITPDPGFLYLTDQHKEALASIIYGIAKRKGFVCITGEVGVGKTTILRSYLDSADEPGLRFVYVFNPNVSFVALLRHIFKEIGLECPAEDIAGMVETMRASLVERHARHETLVLLIDEAQNMPIGTLESLRMLSNLETSTEKLVQIVLVGQPELEHLLAERQLRQLESRIAIRTRLGPLSSAESTAYIRHRLKCVALDDKPAFTEGAIRLIARRAQGIPRRINVLCDTALMTAFGRKARPVSTAIIREVLRDLRADSLRGSGLRADLVSRVPWRAAAALGGVVAAGAVAATVMVVHQPAIHPFAASMPAADEQVAPASAATRAHPIAPKEPSPQASAPSAAPRQTSGPATEVPAAHAQPQPLPTAPAAPLPLTPPSPQKPGLARSMEVAAPAPAPAAPAATPPEPPLIPAFSATPVPAEDGLDVVRIAAPGDTLAGLTAEIYGKADKEHLDWVKAHNPEIIDVDRIQVGQVIAFPALPGRPSPKTLPRGVP
ncbi:MAG: AAA family ATPase [Magnetospirillum sp.]|nr:AAA family ATPase [Magnetospirillum sp.]